MPIESLFATPANLPSIPKVVQQLIQSFDKQDISIDDIASQLAADPVLSAKTLRLANSAYFHVSRTIASVDDALRMLGFVMVRNLVVGAGIVGAFRQAPGLDLPGFWRYSLQTATAARWLAQRTDHNLDLAYTVGLLHGLGQLLLHATPPSGLQALNRSCPPLSAQRAAAERQAWGFDHAQAGAELARRWNFPAEITEAIRHVPAPGLAPAEHLPLAALVHLAAWRARVDALGMPAEEVAATCPVGLRRPLSLPFQWLSDRATLAPTHEPEDTMPNLVALTEGLDAMVTPA